MTAGARICLGAALVGLAACGSTTKAPAAITPVTATIRCTVPAGDPDVILRVATPGDQPTAQLLGASGVCDLAVAPGPGYCDTVALASSNPGYNVNATPAAPLKKVITSVGAGCS